MTRGYLILAQNTKRNDYLKLAYALALSIKNTQTSVTNVAVATDEETIPMKYLEVFDHVVDIPWTDQAEHSKWKIENKWKYYYMSPFDETIVLDADMLFPADIGHWWDILSQKEVWITNKPKTFREDNIDESEFRKMFIANGLPNVYTAFMYFKKTELSAELFKMTELIFENWERFFYEYLDETRPKQLSGDVAYALAIKLLGIESECFGNLETIPSFVHMKVQDQNIGKKHLTDDWTSQLPTYFNEDGTFKVGNYEQRLPFHYQSKSWLTDDMIYILEKRVGIE